MMLKFLNPFSFRRRDLGMRRIPGRRGLGMRRITEEHGMEIVEDLMEIDLKNI